MKRNILTARVLAVAAASALLTVMVQPVFANEDPGNPVTAFAGDGETVSVSSGSISAEGADANQPAVAAIAHNGSEATVNVDGDININASGKESSEEYSSAIGVLENASADSSTTVTVSGDINISAEDEHTGAYGVDVISIDSGADMSVTVEGNVSVSHEADYAGGVMVNIPNEGATGTVEVGGDVTVDSKYAGSGIMANVTNGGEANITVDGNVNAAGENGAVGISTSVSSGGNVNVQVGGDVHGNYSGLDVSGYGDCSGTIDVVIEGTLSGGEKPINYANGGEETNVTVTVWKIEPNKDQKIVCSYEPVTEEEKNDEWMKEWSAEMKAAAEELEKNILYIIKVEQPKAGGTLALAGTTDSHGFATAKEGETVTLKLNLQNGYKLKGAYNGTTALTLIDKDGNYYIVVPKGGGVDLSVLLEQIQSGYIPAVPAAETAKEKKLIDEYEFVAADSEAKISFYDDMTVAITLPGGAKAEGTFKFVDGKLTFNGIELEVTIDADGSYHCIYMPANGEPVEFVLSAEFVENLKKACEKQI